MSEVKAHVPCSSDWHTLISVASVEDIERGRVRHTDWCTVCGTTRWRVVDMARSSSATDIGPWHYPEQTYTKHGTCSVGARCVVAEKIVPGENTHLARTYWCQECGGVWSEHHRYVNGTPRGEAFWTGNYRYPSGQRTMKETAAMYEKGRKAFMEGKIDPNERSEQPIQHADVCSGLLEELTRYTWPGEHHVIRWCPTCGGFAIRKEVRGAAEEYVLTPRFPLMATEALTKPKEPNYKALLERVMGTIFTDGPGTFDEIVPVEQWPDKVAEAWKLAVDRATPKKVAAPTGTYNALREIITFITGGIPSDMVDRWPGIVKATIGAGPNGIRLDALEKIMMQTTGEIPQHAHVHEWPRILNDYLWEHGIRNLPSVIEAKRKRADEWDAPRLHALVGSMMRAALPSGVAPGTPLEEYPGIICSIFGKPQTAEVQARERKGQRLANELLEAYEANDAKRIEAAAEACREHFGRAILVSPTLDVIYPVSKEGPVLTLKPEPVGMTAEDDVAREALGAIVDMLMNGKRPKDMTLRQAAEMALEGYHERDHAIKIQLEQYAKLFEEVQELRELRDELQAANSNYVSGIRAGEALVKVHVEAVASAERCNAILLRELGRLTALLAGFGYREGADGKPTGKEVPKVYLPHENYVASVEEAQRWMDAFLKRAPIAHEGKWFTIESMEPWLETSDRVKVVLASVAMEAWPKG